MADTLKPCCEQTRRDYVERMYLSVQSYPVIKAIPCTTCNQVLKIRVYAPPEEDSPKA